MGTYSQANGGKFGTAASQWVLWTLRGNATAANFFTGGGAKSDGWDVVSNGLDSLKVTPLAA